MTTITTRNEERLSLVRRADDWKNSIVDEMPNKLLKFVDSIQEMLISKLNRIEHKIELKTPNKEIEIEQSFKNYPTNEITSSLVGLKPSIEQKTTPTTLKNVSVKNSNRTK